MSIIHSNGIYHGLPTFSKDFKELSAIVTGASGISGQHMLRILAASPDRWSNIYALSRTPPSALAELGPNIKFVPIDFTKEPAEIGQMLKQHSVTADYVFFFSYAQPRPNVIQARIWTNAQAMCDINGALLTNFLTSLQVAEITPKRILLQTGAKNYGVHLGPAATPQQETDARVDLEPNFYYVQEHILQQYSQRSSVLWNVTRPAAIPGVSQNAAMNNAYAFGVYASVQKYLSNPLVFPGDSRAWEKENTQSCATMNSYLAEWAVLTPEAANHAFNAADGSPFTYGNFWIQLAKWYGVSHVPPDDSADFHELQLVHQTPPRGFSQGTIRYTQTFTEWARQPEVQQAWRSLASQHVLRFNPFAEAVLEPLFGFIDVSVLKSWPTSLSMHKARKLGFFGHVDSCEAIHESIRGYEDLHLLPPSLAIRKLDS